MSYSTDQDLDLLFGQTNVNSWADVDNDEDEAKILARRQWARDQAFDELNSRLADSQYQFPIIGTPPAMLVRIEALMACMFLNEARSITDTEEDAGDLKNIAKRVERFINGIKLGTIKLQGVVPAIETSEVPFAVNDFPQLRRHRDVSAWTDGFNRYEE